MCCRRITQPFHVVSSKLNTIVRVNRRAGRRRIWFTLHCREPVADICHAAAARVAFIRAVFAERSLISARDVDGTARLLNIKQRRLTGGASESSSVPVQRLGSVLAGFINPSSHRRSPAIFGFKPDLFIYFFPSSTSDRYPASNQLAALRSANAMCG